MVSRRARENNSLGTRLSAIQQGMEAIESSTRTPADDGSTDRLDRIERQLELLSSANYRAAEDLNVLGSDYARAQLDPSYIGPGPARVTFLDPPGQAMTTEYFQWIGKFERWGNRNVTMNRIGGVWYIAEHSAEEMYGGKIRLNLGANFTTYNIFTATNDFNEPRAQRLPSGIVVLSGLVTSMTTTTPGQVVFTLPPGYRPDNHTIVQVNNTDQAKVLQITPTGDCVVRGSWVSSTADYASLDGIAFPAAGVASWTDIGTNGSSYQNGWSAVSPTDFGAPGFWKDQYGIVWFRGLLGGGTMSQDLAMVHLPAGYGTHKQTHQLTGAADAFGYVSTYPDATNGKIAWKQGTTTGWVSLARITNVTVDARSALAWWNPKTGNNWTATYNATFPTLSACVRPDGLAMAEGLLGVGTANSGVSMFQDIMAPEKRAIMATVGGDAIRRFDIAGYRSANPQGGTGVGQLLANGSQLSWQSLDGFKWMIG